MKKSLLLFFVLFSSTIISAQFIWDHTEGPEGGATWYMYNNDNYAFYPDEYFLYRTDDGINWEKIPEPALWPIAAYGEKLVAQAFQGNIYHPFYPRLLKISDDNGSSWQTVNHPLESNSITNITWCSHGIYVPVNWQDKLYRSQDEGLTWDTIPTPTTSLSDVYSFNERLYIGNYGGFWRTDSNGENWTELINPQTGNKLPRGKIIGQDDHIIIANSEQLWHSHDDGLSWDSIPNTIEIDKLALDDNIVVGKGLYSVSFSTDFGVTWSELPESTQNLDFIGLATINGSYLFASFNHGVYRWDDSSQSFVLSNQGINSAAVYNMAHDGYNLWAATGIGLSKFDEASQSWNNSNYLPSTIYNYEDVAVGENGLVCATSWLGQKLHISFDDGASWNTEDLPFSYWNSEHDLQIIDNAIFIHAPGEGRYRSVNF
ncbi:MAG: WD40/YVTN/BNR-like repeat-containing protein, partial [Saprospiraceae bacterium]